MCAGVWDICECACVPDGVPGVVSAWMWEAGLIRIPSLTQSNLSNPEGAGEVRGMGRVQVGG